MSSQAILPLTPRFKSFSPCFFVKNVPQSVQYYLSSLGFEIEKQWGEPPVFATLVKDNLTLMLHEVVDENAIQPNGTHEDAFDLYIQTTEIEQLFALVNSREALVHSPLQTREEYSMQEFSVRDPDGYVLVFAEPV